MSSSLIVFEIKLNEQAHAQLIYNPKFIILWDLGDINALA